MRRCESLVNPALINADCVPRKGRLVRQYYGLDGFGIIQQARDGIFVNPEQRAAVDQEFFQRLIRKYPGQIDGENHARDIYINQLRHANKVPEYIASNSLPIGYSDTVFGLRNKVGLLSDSPTENLMQAVISEDPIQKFETHRMLLLAELSMHLHMRTNKAKPYRQLRHIDDLLEHNLYSPNYIGTDTVVINAAHDNNTNAFLGRAGMGTYDNYHLKQHVFQARYVDGIGNVLVHPRKKRDEVSIMKAIHKGLGDDRMNLDQLVSDSMGMMFVALGNEGEPSTPEIRMVLAQQVLSTLSQQYGEELHIQEDHGVGKRSSSEGMNWERYQVTLPGQTLPVELQFYDEAAFTDSMFRVGDVANPKEKNKAHALYEVQRAQSVFETFYPRHIYNGGQYDALYENNFLERLMHEKILSTVNTLKNSRNITYDFTNEGEFNFKLS